MNGFIYVAVGILLTSLGLVLWKFRKTVSVEDYKKKYDDL
jgi:LPXTG-motif cell wall-anchored protein